MRWQGVAEQLASHGFSDAIVEDVANLARSERERLVPRMLTLGPVQVINMNRKYEVSQQKRAEFDAAMVAFNRAAGRQG